jgi:SNF2 family DNA or RNA helicase
MCKTTLHGKDIKIVVDNKNVDGRVNEVNYNIDKMIEQVGTKMAHLIQYLLNNKDNLIIFSEWDEVLHTVGKILTGYNIKNVFCRGNVYQCNSAIRSFNNDEKIKIIMLSATSAASGTNLTKANKIIFINPIYGDETVRKNTEWQAIGRVHRLGQTQKIKVVRFIINNTIEHKIYSDSIANVGIND